MAYQPQPPIINLLKTGTLNALNSNIILEIPGISTGTIQITGTWVGTITCEFTNDDFLHTYEANFISGRHIFTNTTGINGNFRFIALSGYDKVRARMSAYTSGTATVTIIGSAGVYSQSVAASCTHISGAVTAQIIKTGNGELAKIVCGTLTSAGTLSVFDALTGTNLTSKLTWVANSPPVTILYGMAFFSGLTITTTGATTDFSIIYN